MVLKTGYRQNTSPIQTKRSPIQAQTSPIQTKTSPIQAPKFTVSRPYPFSLGKRFSITFPGKTRSELKQSFSFPCNRLRKICGTVSPHCEHTVTHNCAEMRVKWHICAQYQCRARNCAKLAGKMRCSRFS